MTSADVRARLAKVVEQRLVSGAELVWTGPESAASQSRDTAIVVAELFRSATKSVLVSTFVVHQADTVRQQFEG